MRTPEPDGRRAAWAGRARGGLRAACGRIGRAGSSLGRDLAAAAFPQLCPSCGARARADRLLCEACRERIPRLALALCVRCLAAGREPADCARHPGFGCRPAWIYDERAELAVHALKYGGRPDLGPALGEAIVAALLPGYDPDLVVEVPLHRARRRERGYNQAACLADAVAERLGRPRPDGVIVRRRATRAQARLGPAERRANVAGAFRVARPAWVKGRTVLVVDDVVTAGCTLEACLEALRDCGARASAATLAWAQ